MDSGQGQVTLAMPQPHCSSVRSMSTEVSNCSKIEKLTKVCPLCQSEVRLFFVHFNEKMLMCENTECEFPFGHEELQFFKEDETQFESDIMNSTTAAYSEVSSEVWSEINRINQLCDQNQTQDINYLQEDKKETQKKLSEAQLQKSIQHLKSLNTELMNHTAPVDKTDVKIKNEKWIKKLKSIQERTGVELLKPGEMRLLKKEEPVLGLGELKIDINSGNKSNMSCIKIELCNRVDNIQENGHTGETTV